MVVCNRTDTQRCSPRYVRTLSNGRYLCECEWCRATMLRDPGAVVQDGPSKTEDSAELRVTKR